jgi:hypothetical protein
MKKLAVIILAASLATLMACSENSVSPKIDLSEETSFIHVGGASRALTPADTFRFDMTIDPKHNTTWDLGAGNSLTFPRGSLCDVNSTYGPTEWDKQCTPAKSRVTLKVTVWIDANGHPRVDFVPSVRFVPSLDPRDWVILTFSDWAASLSPWFNILYCPTATSACYNEALVDPSVATLRDPRTGKVTRRIKHFSGYNVAAGDETGALSLDGPSLNLRAAGTRSISTAEFGFKTVKQIMSANPGMNQRDAATVLERIRATRRLSGYILASGFDEE